MLATVAAPAFKTLSQRQIQEMVTERHRQEAPDVTKAKSKSPAINLMIPYKSPPNYMVKCPGCKEDEEDLLDFVFGLEGDTLALLAEGMEA